MEGKALAPWTNEQCANIERWQRARHVHPLTCVIHSDTPLLVRSTKLICPFCDYEQTWVPRGIAEQGPTDPPPSNPFWKALKNG